MVTKSVIGNMCISRRNHVFEAKPVVPDVNHSLQVVCATFIGTMQPLEAQEAVQKSYGPLPMSHLEEGKPPSASSSVKGANVAHRGSIHLYVLKVLVRCVPIIDW